MIDKQSTAGIARRAVSIRDNGCARPRRLELSSRGGVALCTSADPLCSSSALHECESDQLLLWEYSSLMALMCDITPLRQIIYRSSADYLQIMIYCRSFKADASIYSRSCMI